MDAIEPYDYRASSPSRPRTCRVYGRQIRRGRRHLPGPRPQPDAEFGQQRAFGQHYRLQQLSTLSENISIDYTAKHYALLPVWMLHTKWQGKDYLFAMNGQTGKLVGGLPVDKRKVAAWFAGISVPLMILLAILL